MVPDNDRESCMLLNQARALELMQRDAVDALVAVSARNVYYLSNYWGLFNRAGGYEAAYLAMVTTGGAEATLVMPALEIRRLESTTGTWMPVVRGYSSPAADQYFADGTARGVDYRGWGTADDAQLTPREKRWLAIVHEHGQQMSADAFWALARSLKAAGLERARIATDDPRLAGWLQARGLEQLDCRYRPQLFNEIRLVKTPAELEILTRAARANEAALLAAVAAMHEGASWSELETEYMVAMARQGGRGVYLTCGVGELPAGEVRPGEPIMFDGLGQIDYYHGDFGRCAVLGRASDKQRRYHQALLAGWDTATKWLRPGVHYSELAAAVGDAVRKAGIRHFRDPVVHSVGLEHTDDPKPAGAQPQTKPDRLLEAGMVVNVDLPHTEIGWGSVHMEDTVVITADGFERLGVADFSLREVPEEPKTCR